ncbi:hypothetical protein F511_40862 [Dorcoceras hygrometricum]|uniref:Uncharacterized protein n=1 Tax=Dorcoceras hygrometricum TaxID=472368 RepID=A0A2Z7DBU3_9LAMI|nr:hypothetical protein F511_40862 [Dorcoceras hygrometricum]
MDRYTADLFLEVRTSMSYISPSSTSEGSTRRFDLTTRVQTRSHNQQLEHCDVLSMQIDSDLVIYQTTLLRTFQVVTICRVDKSEPPPPLSNAAAAAARFRQKFVSVQFDEENLFVLISSVLIVQADEGVSFLVVDRIGDIYRSLPRRADVIVTTVGARHKCQQDRKFETFESNAGRRRVRRCPIACAREARDLRAGRARETHASQSKGATGRDDGRRLLAGSRTRRRMVAHWLGDDARLRNTGWLLPHLASTRCAMMAGGVPPRIDAAGRATCDGCVQFAHDVASRLVWRRASCRRVFVVVAPPPAAAPASLR